MPRYDDRRSSGTRLYVGHLSSRTRSRDLEDMFSRYGRIRDVDMKRDYAFVEFSDPRDADDARYSLNGRDLDGSRIIVEFAKGVPRGPGGSRDYPGRGPTPGSGRCFNCGIDGHWARDCKAGDWKNKCYRCGERGHIERNCQNSPKKLSRRPRSYSRSPSPRRGRSRSRSYSPRRNVSRSRSPVKRERSLERDDRRSRSPKRHRGSPSPSRGKKHSPVPDERSPPQEKGSPSPRDGRGRNNNGSDYSASPRGRNISPDREVDAEDRAYKSPVKEKENGQSRSPSPAPRDDRSPIYDDEDNQAPHRRSESN
ncbi:hypothetical protein HRI_001734100 [Hibiscus trionum]|uniref:Serine/arginine-rich splicing factor RS2Z32-like n=1 Tax=Hibiscus trionum TaxID=183268 RepID=A0A9W7HPV2_HIBTR|nr:hypothetical protein HRI_001734100 [Hibiscus trionum]